MKAIYWVLLLALFACQGRKQTPEDKPDAVRDLLIDRSFWQKETGAHTQDGLAGFHRFTITNTSQRFGYQHIKIRFDYYDHNYQRIDSATRMVEREIEPRSAIRIDTLATNRINENALTAKAIIVSASAD